MKLRTGKRNRVFRTVFHAKTTGLTSVDTHCESLAPAVSEAFQLSLQ